MKERVEKARNKVSFYTNTLSIERNCRSVCVEALHSPSRAIVADLILSSSRCLRVILMRRKPSGGQAHQVKPVAILDMHCEVIDFGKNARYMSIRKILWTKKRNAQTSYPTYRLLERKSYMNGVRCKTISCG